MKIEDNIKIGSETFDEIPGGSCFRFQSDYEGNGQNIYLKCLNGCFVNLESGEVFRAPLESRKYSVVVLDAKVVIE